ncbi:MAG: hypothetical protein R2856_00700 [Caldilineaceae bacterium]
MSLSLRYIGSMVADFHRNLLTGGVFYYPADSKWDGKCPSASCASYECAPMAFLAEQAYGAASDGVNRLLDLQPSSLHERVPFFVGNSELCGEGREFISRFDK